MSYVSVYISADWWNMQTPSWIPNWEVGYSLQQCQHELQFVFNPFILGSFREFSVCNYLCKGTKVTKDEVHKDDSRSSLAFDFTVLVVQIVSDWVFYRRPGDAWRGVPPRWSGRVRQEDGGGGLHPGRPACSLWEGFNALFSNQTLDVKRTSDSFTYVLLWS